MNIDDVANEYIRVAEVYFGGMCSEWKYSGIEIDSRAPHLRYYPENGSVKISLSDKIINDNIQMRFQLAHEVCHLLYPTMSLAGVKSPTTVLNEGVSTHFSVLMTSKFTSEKRLIKNLQDNNFAYYNALQMVRTLLRIDSEAIIKLRGIQPKLNDVEASDFKLAKINAGDYLISNLLSDFK